MGQPPVMYHHSTAVAEPPKCCIIVGDDDLVNVKWEEFTPEKMLEMLYRTIGPVAVPVSTKPTVLQHEVEPTYDDRSPVPTTEAKRKRDFPQVQKDMQRLPNVEASSTLFSTRLILMSDSGGQPNYLDVFPLFVRNRCLALFTLKLNERLDAIPKFSFCIKDEPISMADTMLQCSHGQLLESLAKAMYTFLPSDHTARFTIIGTFADKAEECADESIDDKNAILDQNLKAYKKFQMGKTILPINAVTTNKEQRDDYILKLRERISNAPSITVKIKLRWFGFYLSLQTEAKQRAILSLQECLDIGRSLDMDEQETRKAIQFFHSLNLISYYMRKALSGFVFISLKPVFDLVSLLINVSLFSEDELCDLFGVHLPVGAKKHFQQHGCFSLQILHKCFQFPDRLTSDIFINLLAEVKAIAIIEKSNEFFMPCVLRYASREEEHIVSDRLSSPWIVRLKDNRSSYEELYIPLRSAFFPTLIVLLLSSDLFSIVSGVRQYRNIIVLNYRNGDIVIFIERQLQLEVYYSFNDSECSVIRSFVHKTILETEMRLSFNVDSFTIEDSFPCSCSSSTKRDSRHILCKTISGPPIAQCEATRMKIELSHQELRWLSSGMH